MRVEWRMWFRDVSNDLSAQHARGALDRGSTLEPPDGKAYCFTAVTADTLAAVMPQIRRRLQRPLVLNGNEDKAIATFGDELACGELPPSKQPFAVKLHLWSGVLPRKPSASVV
eukprot:UN4050